MSPLPLNFSLNDSMNRLISSSCCCVRKAGALFPEVDVDAGTLPPDDVDGAGGGGAFELEELTTVTDLFEVAPRHFWARRCRCWKSAGSLACSSRAALKPALSAGRTQLPWWFTRRPFRQTDTKCHQMVLLVDDGRLRPGIWLCVSAKGKPTKSVCPDSDKK